MFYYITRLYVRLALLFFCRSIRVNDKRVFDQKGPLLLACNHPNSFFDAVLLGAKFNSPVHFLARGDAFNKPIVKKILNALKAIPIYRLKEGREYLSLNDATFDKCTSILHNGGIILIFSEGLCINQWELRSLKKGTARISIGAWNTEEITSLRVLPVSLNYNSFNCFGKRILIEFQEPILRTDIKGESEAEQINNFNLQLFTKLEKGLLTSQNHPGVTQFLLSNSKNLVHDLPVIDNLKKRQDQLLAKGIDPDMRKLDPPGLLSFSVNDLLLQLLLVVIFIIPAIAGYLINYPLYFLLKKVIREKTKGTVFYDSAMFAAILITYPFYYLTVNIIGLLIWKNLPLSVFLLLMPFLALPTFWVKDSIQKMNNYFKLRNGRSEKFKELFDLV